MNKERRRLKLAQRQHLIAQVSQRIAMRSLADALGEEARSADLVQRSRALMAGYAPGRGPGASDGLVRSAKFSGGLARLADEAERAREQAGHHAASQAAALSDASTKADRSLERLANTRVDLRAALDRQRQADEPPAVRTRIRNPVLNPVRNPSGELAQNLQNSDQRESEAIRPPLQRKQR